MSKQNLTFAVLAFVVAVMVVAPASAGTVVPGMSFPLLSERDITVRAGITPLVDFSSRPLGPSENVYNGGQLKLIKESYGIFNDLSYARVDPFVANVKPERLKEVETAIKKGTESVPVSSILYTDGAKIIITPAELEMGHYVLLNNVTHDASLRERSGILAAIGQLFGIKKRERITTTDSVAMIFVVIDADLWIEMFSKWSCGVDDPKNLTSEQIQVLRAAFFEDVLARTRPVDSTKPTPSFQLLADGFARRVQGAPAAFQEGLSQLQRELDTANGENAKLRDELAQARQDAETARQTAADAEQRRIEEYNRLTAESSQATNAAAAREHALVTWVGDLKAKHAGKTGFLFVAVDEAGLPTWADVDLHLWQLDREKGWLYNSRSPISVCGGVGEWFWETGAVPTTQWLGIGFSNGPNCQPTCAFQLHQSGLRVIAVRQGGSSYEAK